MTTMLYPDEEGLRETFQGQLERLRGLGVELCVLGPRYSAEQLRRFALEFVDPDRSRDFLESLTMSEGAIDYERWLRPDRMHKGKARGALRWLCAGAEALRCVRLDRRIGLPAVQIAMRTMGEEWLTSWPGAYVHFAAGRALVVTVHYEVYQCDLRGGKASPYR
jgi:hypothetical protein